MNKQENLQEEVERLKKALEEKTAQVNDLTSATVFGNKRIEIKMTAPSKDLRVLVDHFVKEEQNPDWPYKLAWKDDWTHTRDGRRIARIRIEPKAVQAKRTVVDDNPCVIGIGTLI